MILNDENQIQNMNNENKKHLIVKTFNIMKLKKNKTHVEFITNYLREILINKRIINTICYKND